MDATATRPAGLGSSLRAAAVAGLLAGSLLGLADGVVAGLRTPTHGLAVWAGCLGLSVVLYDLFWVALLALLASATQPWLRRRDPADRARLLAGVALGLGVFLELFWWSRPRVFPGLSATDPRRLAASAAMLPVGLLAGWALVRIGRHLARRGARVAGAGLAVLWIAGLALLFSDRSASAARGQVNERTRERPNVLLVVCDALRQDVLGCYGNPRVKTPVADALATRGVLFENAWVQAPFTWSSFGSILTGKYPRRHGLVKMAAGVRMVPNITLPWHLRSAPLAGEPDALRDGDYASAAFWTGTLSHGSGLLRGFDIYFEAMVGHDLVDLASPWSVFRSELLLSLLRTKLDARIQRLRGQDPVATMARRWLGASAGRRFVAMLHFYSTHTPYDPPRRFREMYVDPSYGGPIQSFYAHYREAIERGEFDPTPADEARIAELYYAGVSQADAMLGEVLDELERQGVLDDTLVILTADHGEELGDHGLWEHNHMYETNLRVPLLMALPGRLPAGVRSSALVESVDIVPTVCSLLALDPPHEPSLIDEQGRDRGAIDGHDLVALLRGEVPSVREHAFAENGVYMAVRDARYKLVVAAEALEREDWRAAPTPGVAGAQLYDLVADPEERKNALDRLPAEAERLLSVLRDFDARMPVPRSELIESTRDIEAQRLRLQMLGYANGVGQGISTPPDEQ